MSKIFALVDCNNFYVSCERVFNPKLIGKPVVVLSNNDGCAVARSNEVKDLGIPMGAPYFKYKEVLEKAGTTVFSSNYALYGDMSHRVMQVLSKFSGDLEIYSIDEAFICFDGVNSSSLESLGKEIRERVFRCTGIPVSVGFARTKTLAKMANELAKKDGRKENLLGGVLSLVDVDTGPYLKLVEIGDIWGIGRQYAKMLRSSNVSNAYEFSLLDSAWVREKMTMVGSKTLNELKGVVCYDLETIPDPKKGIASTRSFGSKVTTLKALEEAVASYVTRACEKLRKEKLAASYLQVFVMTDRFKEGYYYNSIGVSLPNQLSYTPELIKHALECLKKLYRPNLEYKKAGVFVTDLVPENSVKFSLFEDPEIDKAKRDQIMKTMDKINSKYGKHTLKTLAQGLKQPWQMKTEKRSPRYTTVWGEVLGV